MNDNIYTNLNIKSDMALALTILESFNFQSTEVLTLVSSCKIDEISDTVTIIFPEWLISLSDAFNRTYGQSKGPYALVNVVQILIDDWVHDNRLTSEVAKIFMALVSSRFHSEKSATRH